jgi:DNA-directed RNA polymerase subunit beta'
VKANAKVKKGDLICDWDPYNAVIVSEFAGAVEFEISKKVLLTVKNPMNKQALKKKLLLKVAIRAKSHAIKIADK